jgi:hypothetical protein
MSTPNKVLSNVGSFTDIEGGHVYPDLVAAEPEAKPIRVFLCDGRNDNRRPASARSHGRVVLLLMHFIPDSLTYSVPPF